MPPATTAYSTNATAVVPPVPEEEDDSSRGRGGLLIALGLLIVVLIAGAAYLLPRMFEYAPEDVQTPNLIGKNEQQARRLIGDAGLAVGAIEHQNHESVPAGRVISQDPSADAFVAPDTMVALVISLGRPEVEVPDVIGDPLADAQAELEAVGLQVRAEEEDSDEEEGRVIRTEPSQGQTVADGTTVTVYYSDGPEEIPGVVGMMQGQAKNAIRNAGFRVETIENPNTTEPAGTVLSQSPQAGTRANQGTTVTLVVSSYVEPSETTEPSPSEPPTETESPDEEPPPPAGRLNSSSGRAERRSSGRAGRRRPER